MSSSKAFILLVEDASNNVRTVCSSLACPILKLQEGFLDFRPVGIGCHGQEDVRLAPIVTDCHGILEELDTCDVCCLDGWRGERCADPAAQDPLEPHLGCHEEHRGGLDTDQHVSAFDES